MMVTVGSHASRRIYPGEDSKPGDVAQDVIESAAQNERERRAQARYLLNSGNDALAGMQSHLLRA